MAISAADALRELGSASSDFDHLRVSGDPTLLKFLDRHAEQSERGVAVERVVFSDEVIKINKREKAQKRDLIITNSFIYNFEPKRYKECKRDIAIKELRGLVLCETNGEMLIQVRNDYDYRYLIVRAADVIQSIMKLYSEQTGQALPLMVTQEDLSKFQVFKGQVRKMSGRNSGIGLSSSLFRIRQGSADVTARGRSDSNAGVQVDATLEAKPSKEGWIAKRGEVNNQWRLRYFRLNQSNLLYYEARLRSSQFLECGQVKQWINKRISVEASEHKLTAPNQMFNILREPERAKAFVKYCRSGLLSDKALKGAENAEFYLAVEQWRELSNPQEMDIMAGKIYLDYVVSGANQEITAPVDLRSALGEALQSQRGQLTNDFWDELQQLSLTHLQNQVLPFYIEYSRVQASHDENYQLKTELSELDKKQSNCSHCLASLSGFSIFSKRQLCRHCGEVHCKECLNYEAILPEEFGVADPVKVCDMCHGVLTYGNHPHAFSYVSPKCRPINLAAPSASEMNSWMNAFQAVVGAPNPGAVKVRKEGWLMLEMANKSWRRTYLILDSNRLYYYELKLKGTVALGEGAGVHASNEVKATLNETDCNSDGMKSESNFAHRFNISYKQRIYLLSADTETAMFEWIDAVNKAIRKRQLDRNRPQVADQYSEAFHEEAPVGEVTFVFTDVQNSTKLWEAVAEGMNKALELHDALLRKLLKEFKGYEVKTEGDAFMVTFFNPLDAIRWCLAVQKALLDSQWPQELLRLPAANQEHKDGKMVWNGIRIRMGIHTGAPACRRNPVTGRMDYFGPVVNRSARVADSAHGGQVICTEEVQSRLASALGTGEWKGDVKIDDLGSHKYKGISELVKVYQISSPELAGRNPFPPLRTKEEGETPKEEEKESLAQTMRRNRARTSANLNAQQQSAQNIFLQAPREWEGDEDSDSELSGSFEIAPELIASTPTGTRNKAMPANSLCVAINLATSLRSPGAPAQNNLFHAASQATLQMSLRDGPSPLAAATSPASPVGSPSNRPPMPRRPAPSLSTRIAKFQPIPEKN